MARFVDVHPDNPQPRLIRQIVDVLQNDGVIAYPTDSCFALGCQLGNRDGLGRMRDIRHLDERHHFTLMCGDFGQLGQFVQVSNSVFRLVKASVPGPYTVILPATREVPRRLWHPRKRTVGVRVPRHTVAQAILAQLGEPLVSTTLLLPGQTEPMRESWDIKELLDHAVDAVVAGECGTVPTTVVDLSDDEAVVLRVGAGDPSRFE